MTLDVDKLSIADIKQLLRSSDDKQKREIIDLLDKDNRAGAQRLVGVYRKLANRNEQTANEFKQLSSFEDRLRRKGFLAIAGVDEAGRGALAGPLVAAAVILPADVFLPGLKESKQLLPEIREEFREKIIRTALDWHVEVVMPSQIDQRGLHKTNLHALEQAVLNLSKTPDYVLSDGFALHSLKIANLALIEGDKLSVTIAAASIIAKVERDRLMVSYAREFPDYGFEHHKGYGTKEHLEALERCGPCPIHRLSFRPVRECVDLKFSGM